LGSTKYSKRLKGRSVQELQGKLEKHRCKPAGPGQRKELGDTMPFAAAAGACVWGPNCQVPLTHGHLCTRCKLPAHTACTFENVMAFAARHRGTGVDGERQYARAVETADTAVCPVCLELPGVASSVQAQGGMQATCPPSLAAGGPSSPAPWPSTPRSHRCR
jgi:hypothetical protein